MADKTYEKWKKNRHLTNQIAENAVLTAACQKAKCAN